MINCEYTNGDWDSCKLEKCRFPNCTDLQQDVLRQLREIVNQDEEE